MITIEFNDLNVQYWGIRKNMRPDMGRVLARYYFITGKGVAELEEEELAYVETLKVNRHNLLIGTACDTAHEAMPKGNEA